MILTILLLIIVGFALYKGRNILTEQLGGGKPRPFADIGQSIGNGVPGSYDGKNNLPSDRNPKWPIAGFNFGQPDPTHYGHGIPQRSEDHKPGPMWNPLLTFHNLNVRCSPKCCPSPYSCDKGCICTTLQDLNY